MPAPSAEELDELRGLLAMLSGKDPSLVTRSSKLREDLDLDSLGMMELLFEAEDLFQLSIELPMEELANLVTVGDLQDALKSKCIEND
jgi:acyl carrier protein